MPTRKKTVKKKKTQKTSIGNKASERTIPHHQSVRSEGESPIVGIGASAGGLEAIEGFFSHTPSKSGMTFVIIQHLAPDHKSIMDSLLKKYTEMELLQVKSGMKIEPNCVYLNPPDRDVSIMNRRLFLSKPTEKRGARLPIDHFFRSLAEDQGEKAICIVLSGTGTDGTLGLKAIKGAGGMAMAQDLKQARYENMPRSAIETGLVDYNLPVEQMFDEMIKYAQHPYIGGTFKALSIKQKFEDHLGKIFMMIRAQTGQDFSHYKQNTIRRRIERRMAVHQIEEIGDYIHYLQKDSAEVETLFKDMLITVTNFFRDPEAFEFLNKKALTSILGDKSTEDSLRVWIPGCATGEEAYSIAILIAENMVKLNKHLTVQVFATDIDMDAIECARQGIYPDSIAADVSVERLNRFFTKQDSSYRVKKQVREMVIFATQNLIKDAPFSKLDLVCCRNVLIYMDSFLQKKILPLFHYTLNPDGFLFLGTSETVGDYSDRFTVVNPKWKIFRRKSHPSGKVPGLPVMPLYDSETDLRKTEGHKALSEVGVRQVVERTILQNYGPPCVLINQKNEILYFHGKTDKFLIPPTGEPTFDILKMAREELRYKLSSIIHRARKENKAVTAKGIRIKHYSDFLMVDLIVRPVAEDVKMEGMMMVVFESKKPSDKIPPKTMKGKDDDKIDTRITTLEQELQSTREYLQTTIEELETSNEELKSTNEELQSTNEELETSREELQSTNEELETVNSELQDKVNQLAATNDDLNNLLASTDIGTIFLDMDLCVKRFTPSASKIFNLIKTDMGRPISDITSTIDYPMLRADAEETLRTLIPKESDLQAVNGNWFSVRVLPYRTIENVIDGVVMTFVDITKQVQQAKEMLELAKFPEENPNPVFRFSKDGIILYGNTPSQKILAHWKRQIGETLPGKWLDVVLKS